MFVYRYSQLPVVRFRATGLELRSSVDRSPSESAFLNLYGAAIEAAHLQGYLFFGTAERIVDYLRERINRHEGSKLRFLILDFRHVAGADSAATACFLKSCSIAKLGGVHIVFSNASPEIVRLIMQAGIVLSTDALASLIVDMDHALEFCETALLAEMPDRTESADLHAYLESIFGVRQNLNQLIDVMERIELKSGETLIRIGDMADDVYILKNGRVRVQMVLADGRVLRLRTMTSGAVVGEMAFYLQEKRTAEVVAERDSVFYRLRAAELLRLERENGDVAALAHRLFATVLAVKLTQANKLIQFAHN